MSRADATALSATREKLERWRKEHGGRGCWIPGELWDEAVEVARESGVEATAQALRLNGERLQNWMSRQERKEIVKSEPETEFVEMGPLCNWRTVVELVGRDGEQMRIEVTGPNPVDVAGLFRTFWSRPT